ncbi:Asp-tRNA(Asn)/Glu-tRNA(Gln) amidotransferase GatCAB subunit B, partial [bacterium]|nr:Asp-tRNA(Asn)/Glu-tRNA(Gln) amidotransferase GatCAB subunit B [bacterium]
QQAFGEKVEIKNMNTISGVRRALAFEIQRQIGAARQGQSVVQETRRWDEATGRTFVMRTKEYAHDYRYFPEPDLMPFEVTDELLADIRRQVVELPEARRQRLVREFGLPEYDAGVLVADRAVADFFEAAARASRNPKAVSNWVMTELLAKLAETRRPLAECPVQPPQLAALVGLVEQGQISGKIAKEVFAAMFASGADPAVIVQQQGLAQVSDAGELEALVDQVMAAQPKSVADYRAGNTAAINFLKGQVMRLTKGQANPQLVGEILERKLRQG